MQGTMCAGMVLGERRRMQCRSSQCNSLLEHVLCGNALAAVWNMPHNASNCCVATMSLELLFQRLLPPPSPMCGVWLLSAGGRRPAPTLPRCQLWPGVVHGERGAHAQQAVSGSGAGGLGHCRPEAGSHEQGGLGWGQGALGA
jgi:hypothetical protein